VWNSQVSGGKLSLKVDALGEWRRTHLSDDITPELEGREVVLLGWVRDIRNLGGISFFILQDKAGIVQITIPRQGVDNSTLKKVELIQRQYSIAVKGKVKKMAKAPGGAEVIPNEIRILGLSQQPLPMDITGRTHANIDVRLDTRILDLRQDQNQAIFRIQHVVCKTTRDFFSKIGFMEVHTPRIISTATEGGAALFPVAYFDREAFLAQSPQLYKEQLVIDFERVFEIGTFFRAEQSHTRRHLSEFISIDMEQAFADADDVMKLLEELIHQICKVVTEKCKKELKLLKNKIVIPQIPLKRYTYDEIINELNENLREKSIQIAWGEDIPTEAFRALGVLYPGFYFITDWPTKSKPFYIKPRDNKPKLCEAFDLMWRWIELASGGTRVNSKEILVQRLAEQGLNAESFKYHLQAFDYGMPPHAGWATGLERLMMMLTGRQNIREVVLFPRDRYRLTP
jgi:aspartyl-tRNA synthetase